MRRATTILALGACLLGCGPASPSVLPGDGVALLTGIQSCYAGAQSPNDGGLLIPDAEFGTRIDGRGPVMWPVGYTGKQLPTGEIAVLNTLGEVIATTGNEYAFSPVPKHQGEATELMARTGAIGVCDSYPWDFVEGTQ